jgi:hypothetical protein
MDECLLCVTIKLGPLYVSSHLIFLTAFKTNIFLILWQETTCVILYSYYVLKDGVKDNWEDLT